jgi:hypothetical protein
MNTEQRIENLEKRLAVLEKERCQGNGGPALVEMDLTLLEADIYGLHFNKTEVHAVFEKKDDGWYHSRDILFLSARNTGDDNSRDILTEYLNRHESHDSIRSQIALVMKAKRVPHVEISLPKENEGVKQYNGVDYWYWLEGKYSGSAANFCYVRGNGNTSNGYASAVGGCAPMFRVKE